MWKVWIHDKTWRISLAIGALGMASACSGNATVDGSGGSGGSGGVGGAGAGGGGAEPGLYDAFCDARAACKSDFGASNDPAACKASAQCDSMLLHHPGGPLFDCADSCSMYLCLSDLYLDYSDYSRVKHTEAAKEFEERCRTGCPVFEDFCLAGALFTDEALETMTKCFDLATCEEVKSCALETYAPCTAWVYQISP